MARQVGIIVNLDNLEACAVAHEAITWLGDRGIEVRTNTDTAKRLEMADIAVSSADWAEVEFIISLGGDGTILMAARRAAPIGIPILGVHMGRFGFIAESHPEDLIDHLEQVLAKQALVEERMMVCAEVWRRGERIHTLTGLNDTLVRSRASQLLQVHTRLSGADFATYPADGIIISTPTGSTAYSLSAGGPLVAPTVQAMILTPICPHTLSARPMVVPSHEIIEVEIETDSNDVICCVDGMDPVAIESGDRIVVRRAECVTRLIVLSHATFYRKVRDRYLYGERLNE